MSIRRIALLMTALAAIFALSVRLAGAQTIATEGKWTGEVNSADASTLVVSGVLFQATGAQVEAGLTLTPGTVVQVKFNAANGSLNAVKVERLEAGDDDLPGTGKITGTIDSATADTISLGGVPFAVTGARIDDDASLNAGSLVELRFTFNGTALTVSQIEAEDDENDAKAIGVIEAMDATTITVGGVAFDITSAQIDDEGELAVGVLVEIEFTVTDDGRVIALDVEFEDDDLFDDNDNDSSDDNISADFVLSGRIEAIDGTRLTVNGVTVDTNGARMDDDTLEVGDAVTLYFQRDASGALTVIKVDEIDDVDDPFDDDRDDDDDSEDSDDDSSDDNFDDATVINGCVRPDGWQTYRVGRGDTLGRIAGAANTTVDALMTANCLTSANFITVGQPLFVPIRISRPDDDNDERGSDNDNDDDDDNDNDDDNGGDDDNGNDNDDDDDNDDNGNDNDDNDDDDDDDDNGGGDDDDGDDD